MTSKGAVELVKEVYQDDLKRVPSNICLKLIIEGLEQAEKDLEVLEILKHIILGIEETFNQKEFNESGIIGTIIKDYFINNDITGKVEEWLDNEN